MNFKNINLLGLNTYASHRVTEKNYLLDCNNIVADQMGVIGTRRGQEFLGTAFTLIKKIFSGINELFVQADDSLYYDNAGTFTEVIFDDSFTFGPISGTLVQSDSQNKTLYFTGRRTFAGSGRDKNIKKLVKTTPYSAANAGLDAPINISSSTVTGGTGFQPNDSVRIRVFYQYIDSDGYNHTSQVSESIVCTNTTGSECDFSIKYQIPPQFNSAKVDVYYAISNTVNNFTPDDNLFWGNNTLIQRSTGINEGLSSLSFTANIIPRENIENPVDLYTNASQEGVLQNNDPPLSAKDIETYSGYTFYSNVEGRQRIYYEITDLPIGQIIFTCDGISYQRSAASNYEVSPVLFSGSTITDYSYDLVRAITSTQSEINAVIDINSIGEFGTEWVDEGIEGAAPVAWSSSCVSTNGVIYEIGGFIFSAYNIEAKSRNRLPDMPAQVEGASLVYVESSNRVYSIGGYISGTTQAPIYWYDINQGRWFTGSAMPAAPGGGAIAFGTAQYVLDNRIYYFFGANSGSSTNQNYWYRYDVDSDSFPTGGTIPTTSGYGRIYPSSAVVSGNIYIFGGAIEEAPSFSSDAFKFNTTTQTFTSLADMGTTRGRFGCASVGASVYLINGSTDGTTYLDTVSKYDTIANSYSSFENTLEASSFNSAVTYNSTIYRVGGNNAGAIPQVESYRVGGVCFYLEERFVGDGAINAPETIYIKLKNQPFTQSAESRFTNEAFIQFSKQGQPEAVPFFNSFNVGSASSPIVRIAALRSSLLIFKSDGVYQLNGISPETFGLQQLDPTCQIIAAQSLAKLDNEIYCLTSKGVACINESGARIISYPIKDLIDSQLYSVPEANWNTAITATAYDLDYKYVITIGDKTFTYNYITEQWTIWHAGNANIKSWTVFENKIYYADTTRVLKERKSFTSADFQDENGNGIDAFMQFNNLEFSPGRQLLIQDMQILQRNISNLTVGIQFENDFNTPASFDKTLDAYVSRVFPPNGSRQAFYFRPKFTWNTEIVAAPGTFATSSFEGLDIGYEELKSNLR